MESLPIKAVRRPSSPSGSCTPPAKVYRRTSRRLRTGTKRAALQGLIDAQRALADLYLNGQGVPKSATESKYWSQKAANQAADHLLTDEEKIRFANQAVENERLTAEAAKAQTSLAYKDQSIGYKSSPAREDGTTWNLGRIAGSSNNQIYLSRPDQSVYETIKTSDAREVVGVGDRIGNAANVNPVLLLRESNDLNAAAFFDKDGSPFVVINKKIWDLIKNDRDMAAALIGHETAHLYFHHPGATATTDAIGSILGILAGVALETAALRRER